MPDDAPPQLPAAMASTLAGVPAALVPSCLKALDRLVGASIDIPVAWLAQQKAKIDAQTQAYALVEGAIAKAAASEVSTDSALIERAVAVLVGKSYRKQGNREAVAVAMVEELDRLPQPEEEAKTESETTPSIDDDWLNVFERFAEDASSERMQKLWGRVIAGEVRKPGRYSLRTLRFLSEFSQSDALALSDFSECCFGGQAPKNLVNPGPEKDIRDLIYLESWGIVQGAGGVGIGFAITLDQNGRGFLREGDLAIMFEGTPGTRMQWEVLAVTPLGQELLGLLPGRDARAAARGVASSMRRPEITSAFVVNVAADNSVGAMETLWQDNADSAVILS